MSVVEFNKQLRFIERVFYTYFCILIRNNYCGYPINIDEMMDKIDDIYELFLEYEYTLDIFENKGNFTTFLINETHGCNKGYFNEEENNIYLLFSQEEINNTLVDSNEVLDIASDLYLIMRTEKFEPMKRVLAS